MLTLKIWDFHAHLIMTIFIGVPSQLVIPCLVIWISESSIGWPDKHLPENHHNEQLDLLLDPDLLDIGKYLVVHHPMDWFLFHI